MWALRRSECNGDLLRKNAEMEERRGEERRDGVKGGGCGWLNWADPSLSGQGPGGQGRRLRERHAMERARGAAVQLCSLRHALPGLFGSVWQLFGRYLAALLLLAVVDSICSAAQRRAAPTPSFGLRALA